MHQPLAPSQRHQPYVMSTSNNHGGIALPKRWEPNAPGDDHHPSVEVAISTPQK